MKKQVLLFGSFSILAVLLSACSGVSALLPNTNGNLTVQQPTLAAPTQVPTPQPVAVTSASSGALAAYEGTLENIYARVSPEVVSLRVVQKQSTGPTGSNSSGQLPFPFSNIPGFGSGQQQAPVSEALGSGFVWDNQGHIVTNDHVITGADTITVTFSDGTSASAKVIGADPASDLAVVQVDPSAASLLPAQLADSTQVKVGQLAVAIGNPFGLQNTMTVGIVSALGRSIDSNQATSFNGASYSIPDIIQTDAPINPGNSGGVLVNDQGQVIGVTSAIESSTQSSAGIGFAIPSSIVQQIIPELIVKGHFDHAYLGIAGTSLTPELAQAMNLSSTQRGALVESVTSGGPSDKAGLQGSTKTATVDGQQAQVGGDVIIAIDNQPVKSMDDVISYLFDHTTVGQKVTLTILRNGNKTTVDVTLEARPQNNASLPQANNSGNGNNNNPTNGQAWLGVQVISVDSAIAQSMNLPTNQTGVLVEAVQNGSPAEKAGLQGSSQPATDNGQQFLVGGDIIVSIDNQAVTSVNDLQGILAQDQPGQQITLTILRNDKKMTLPVVLGTR